MKNDNIYKKWIKFIDSDKYKIYFMTNIDLWYNKLNQVKQYIDEYGKRPSEYDKHDNNSCKLGRWLNHQISQYKTKDRVMKQEHIYKEFENFITPF
jgi:hypothetical protein